MVACNHYIWTPCTRDGGYSWGDARSRHVVCIMTNQLEAPRILQVLTTRTILGATHTLLVTLCSPEAPGAVRVCVLGA